MTENIGRSSRDLIGWSKRGGGRMVETLSISLHQTTAAMSQSQVWEIIAGHLKLML
jgi:hypothetical protein